MPTLSQRPLEPSPVYPERPLQAVGPQGQSGVWITTAIVGAIFCAAAYSIRRDQERAMRLAVPQPAANLPEVESIDSVRAKGKAQLAAARLRFLELNAEFLGVVVSGK